MARVRLLSTDFDGTLIGFGSDGRCTPALASVLAEHKRSGGLWAINTGRNLWHAQNGVASLEAPVEPDFLLTNEREIFHRTPDGRYVPEHHWNETCYRHHDELFRRAEPVFQKIRALASRHEGIDLIEEDNRPAGIITSSEGIMQEFVDFLEALDHDLEDFSYQRNTIYLRFSHAFYHKGSALGELSRITGIDPREIMAAGDHFNDIPMLDGRYAVHAACPSNSIPEVVATVRAAGGYHAGRVAADGVAEAWHHFSSTSRDV